MNFRDPEVVGLGVLGAGLIFLPGRGLMWPALWFGAPHVSLMISMAVGIFLVVYFGVLQFWKLASGDPLQPPLPALLALFLAVRLSVDCARMLMWR